MVEPSIFGKKLGFGPLEQKLWVMLSQILVEFGFGIGFQLGALKHE